MAVGAAGITPELAVLAAPADFVVAAAGVEAPAHPPAVMAAMGATDAYL